MKKPTMPRLLLAAGAAAAIALALAANSGAEEAKAMPNAAPAPLLLVPADLVTADLGSVAQGVKVTGTLEPRQRTAVNARIAAVVDQVLVREGERVRAGQVLLRQNSADAAAQLRQAEAHLESAKVELQLTAALEQKKAELYKKNYVSEIDFAAAQGETKVKASLVAVQEANVAIARKALADTAIHAPIGGMVAERFVEPGTNVMPGQALMSLVDLSELELAASIPARDINLVRIGNEVTFGVDGYPGREFRGTVARINPMASGGARTITIYALVDNRKGELKGGMFASGRIVTGADNRQAVRIPYAAVRRIAGQDQVWLVRDGKLALQTVTLGVRDSGSGLVEVKQGIADGEQVILADIGNRKAGMPVSVTDAR
jgi:RND family efflux transporter MFP subunit